MAADESRLALEEHGPRLADYGDRPLREPDTGGLRAGLEDRIRARPIASVLIAAATGYLLGRLLRS